MKRMPEIISVAPAEKMEINKMKFENDWLIKLFTDTDFITQLTALLKSLTAISNMLVIALFVYLPYQAIREVMTWFH